jgi:hypothetical protein
MGHKVVVFDISVVRALWETRVKKHKAWQKKEAERLERSALEKYAFLSCSSSLLSNRDPGSFCSAVDTEDTFPLGSVIPVTLSLLDFRTGTVA